MTFNFLGPGLTVNVEAKVKEQIILDSSDKKLLMVLGVWIFAQKVENRRFSRMTLRGIN